MLNLVYVQSLVCHLLSLGVRKLPNFSLSFFICELRALRIPSN